jgi:hypothetical protein
MSGNTFTEAEIIQVQEVAFTDTFHPIHHREVISAMRNSVQNVGLEIVNTEYTLAKDGLQFFGVWDLSHRNADMCWSIGLRNSMDKSLALGIVAGTRVFVCSNLAFSGEYIEFRKHTKGLDIEELEYLAFKAMRKMVKNLTEFQTWHERLANYSLTETDAKALLVNAMAGGVFPPSKFSRFDELYFKGECEPSLFGFHEACTNLLRDTNLRVMPKRNFILNGIINQYINCPKEQQVSALGDFYESRASAITKRSASINNPSQ